MRLRRPVTTQETAAAQTIMLNGQQPDAVQLRGALEPWPGSDGRDQPARGYGRGDRRHQVTKKHFPGPQGVPGRNSDDMRLREVLRWEPEISLERVWLAPIYASKHR